MSVVVLFLWAFSYTNIYSLQLLSKFARESIMDISPNLAKEEDDVYARSVPGPHCLPQRLHVCFIPHSDGQIWGDVIALVSYLGFYQHVHVHDEQG